MELYTYPTDEIENKSGCKAFNNKELAIGDFIEIDGSKENNIFMPEQVHINEDERWHAFAKVLKIYPRYCVVQILRCDEQGRIDTFDTSLNFPNVGYNLRKLPQINYGSVVDVVKIDKIHLADLRDYAVVLNHIIENNKKQHKLNRDLTHPKKDKTYPYFLKLVLEEIDKREGLKIVFD